MVVVKLIGGLGNQLFQYAAGRMLSILHNTELKLDVTSFEHYDWHTYSLKPFQVNEVFASQKDVAAVKGTSRKRLSRIIFYLNKMINPCYKPPIFTERNLRPYNPRITRTTKNVYLDGYWQSEKYFANIQDVIRHEFTVKYQQDHESQEIGKTIAETQSVSIHIRRGNYISNPKLNKIHGTCSLEYYQECVRRIAEKIAFPHFFVFSDDPRWVRENLNLEHPTTFISHNDAGKDYEDLRLMSMCQHQIIANSTFSWWAAWLNPNPNKIILAPRRWFNDASADTQDLLPDDWIKV